MSSCSGQASIESGPWKTLHAFPQLLAAIDEADRELMRKTGAEADATMQSRNNER
jgi:hypothetical protein